MSTDKQNDTDIRTAAQQTFTHHLEYLSSGRIPEWVALFAEDGTLEFPYGPEGYPNDITGHAGLLDYMQNFPKMFDVTFHGLVFHETTDPTLVIAEFASRGTALATDRPYEQRYISVVSTRDALITRYVDFWNPLVAIESLAGTSEDFVKAFTS